MSRRGQRRQNKFPRPRYCRAPPVPGTVRGSDDGRHVLHFHGDRAGALAPHQPGVLPQQRFDGGIGRVEIHSNAEAAQNLVGKVAVRPVNAVGDEHVVSRLQERNIDERNGALSSWREEGAKSLLQFAHPSRQFERSGRAIKPIGVAHGVLVPVVVDRSSIREQDGRAAVNRRHQRTKPLQHTDIRMNELGLPISRHEEG